MVAISAPPPNSVYAVKSLHVFKLFADVRARPEPREGCPNVCANNLYDDYDFNINSYDCDKSTSCMDQCCQTVGGVKYVCQGESCQPPDPCKDNPSYYDRDSDGYKRSDCPGGTDCDDANANIYPGSCNAAAVAWSSTCATSATGGCGTGTCARALPSGCGDVCGDSKVTGSEGCDWVLVVRVD